MHEGELPLIPKSKGNHDTKSVIRDIFQNILSEPKYPRNVADNLVKNNVECTLLKCGAIRTKTIIAESLLCVEDIEIAETKLMLSYGKHLLGENVTEDSRSIKERRMLSRTPLYQDVDKRDAKKYGLVRENDLYACNLITSMDFKINPLPHICTSLCGTELDLIPSKLETRESQHMSEMKNMKMKSKTVTFKTAHVAPASHFEEKFRPSTSKIIFENYKLNTTYKKKFKFQNVSRHCESFQIDSYPATKYFKLESNDSSVINNKIPPGMYTTFTVFFKTDTFMDVHDTIQFSSKDQRIEVAVASSRNPPNLFMFIIKKSFPAIFQAQFDVARSIVLNCDIDCEGCFRGKEMQITLIVKNTGGFGRFLFVPEDDFVNENISGLHDTLEVEVGPFTIYPGYFEIEEQEYMIVLVEFFGKHAGLNLETVYLMCNNATYEIMDILADCVVFDEYCLKVVDDELLSIDQLRNLVCPDNINISSSFFQGYESSVKCIFMRKQLNGYNDDNSWANSFNEGYGGASTSEETVQPITTEPYPVATTDAILEYLRRITVVGAGEHDVKQEPIKVHGKYLIYFGVCRTCESTTRTVSITNNCLVDINYCWKIGSSPPSGLECGDIYDLNHDCVVVQEYGGSNFRAYTTTDFTITLTPDSTDSGYYRLRLSLYAQRIPKKAILDQSKFILLENEEPSHFDILVAQFDVVCHIQEVIIEIIPEIITVDHEMVHDEEVDIHFCIRIYTFDNVEPYDCTWDVKSSGAVQIERKELRPRENELVACTLKVINRGYDDIHENIELIVNKIHKKTLIVSASVRRSLLKIIQPCLDFGTLEIGNTYMKIIQIRNENCKRVNWDLWEEQDETVLEKNETEIVVIHLKSGDLELHYIVKATMKANWVSTLYLYTINGDERNFESSCEIKYQTAGLQVYIHTPMSKCPILCPDELLYVNIRSTYTLCIHNKSPITTNFRFGIPYGAKENLAAIEIIPNSGPLPADSVVRVGIHITPLVVGVLDEIFIPCYLESTNKDLYGDHSSPELTVSVLCASEDIIVRIKLPGDENKEGSEIIWPPQMVYDFDYNAYGENSEQVVEHETSSNGEENTDDDDLKFYEPMTKFSNITDYLNHIYTRMYEESEESEPPVAETSNFTSDSDFRELATDSLKDHFGSGFVTQHALVEFYGVSLRTVVSKTIAIQNVTPLCGDLKTTLTNFPAVDTPVDRIENVMVKMNIIKSNKWELAVSKHGVCFTVELENDKLEPFESTNMTISAYANTWGIYADEITLEINNVVPFVFTVIVEVVGLPLEFPIAINCTHKCPIFRFGSVQYMSDSITRKVYVKNTSIVPVSVVWHVFMRTKKEDETQPITLLFDVYHPNLEETQCSSDSLGGLAITHGNIAGTSESQIFKLLPKETYVKPGETVSFNVKFDPKVYVTSSQKTEVEAYLIGYIQLVQQFKSVQNMITRRTGSNMQPCKMKMTATLELPKLLLDVSGSLGFTYKATEVIDFVNFESSQILNFKNNKSMSVIVGFDVEEPLRIISIRTPEITSDVPCTVVVRPGETAEVIINCTLDRGELFSAANNLYLGSDIATLYKSRLDLNDMAYKYNKYLYVQQKGMEKQAIPFEISILYPQIEATDQIDFGNVYVGNAKKQIFTLRNLRGSTVPFYILSCDELVVSPEAGILPAAKFNAEHIDVSVIFIPNEYKAYNEDIIIKTNIPMYSFTVNVIGIATHDQKYFVHEQC